MKKQYTMPTIKLINIYMQNATMGGQINVYSATGGSDSDPSATDNLVTDKDEQLSNKGNIWGNKSHGMWGE